MEAPEIFTITESEKCINSEKVLLPKQKDDDLYPAKKMKIEVELNESVNEIKFANDIKTDFDILEDVSVTIDELYGKKIKKENETYDIREENQSEVNPINGGKKIKIEATIKTRDGDDNVDNDEEDGEDEKHISAEPFFQISIVPREKHEKGKEIVAKGDICFVSRADGYLYSAEVIETRNRDDGNFEYYVHFLDLNRRLDEWVTGDRLHMSVNTDQLKNDVITENCEDYEREFDFELSLQSDNADRKSSRTLKKLHNDDIPTPTYPDMDEEEAERERDHLAQTKVKNIEKILLGEFEISTWYYSPYPEPYEAVYWQHCDLCKQRAPPGQMIYKKDNIEVYEVDGTDYKLYCQLLCLLAKLFLDHKTLFYEMDPFLFYVLCEVNDKGSHIVGYFSKEKDSIDNNVACILVLPPFQRKGYGKFLIGFSYELSIIEGLPGTPEKPLSDLGKISYVSYWCYTLLTVLEANSKSTAMSLDGMREHTGMVHEDIIYTLQTLKLLKYWKSHTIAVLQPNAIRELLRHPQYRAPRLLVDRDCLKWTPSETALNKAKMKKTL